MHSHSKFPHTVPRPNLQNRTPTAYSTLTEPMDRTEQPLPPQVQRTSQRKVLSNRTYGSNPTPSRKTPTEPKPWNRTTPPQGNFDRTDLWNKISPKENLGSSQTWLFQTLLLQLLHESALFEPFCSFALFCALLRSLALFCALLRSVNCALLQTCVCAHLRSFARFCVRPHLERPCLVGNREWGGSGRGVFRNSWRAGFSFRGNLLLQGNPY